ncbi:hypothetical protein ACQEVZ_06375 [Dactylosporangium sp. CA-152071]|uniref:hypothetical protein n=1 Tax=Dactylosporangium sp. CA-152071 TaxID=3239933 RepID=UPI003D8CFFA1
MSIDGDRMRVVVSEDALADLGLEDAEIIVKLAADPQTLATFREYLARIFEYLARILTYGRLDARPAVLRL